MGRRNGLLDMDGTEYLSKRIGRIFHIAGHVVGLVILCSPVLMIFAVVLAGLFGSWDADRIYHVEGETPESPSLEEVRDVVQGVVPSEARNIKVEKHNGDFMGGASLTVKCTVPPDALRRFARKEGLALRFDSTLVNACTNGPEVRLEIPGVYGDFWKNDWRDAQGTGEFWSYMKVYPNHGGTRCVYFVSTETFFYDWSSN